MSSRRECGRANHQPEAVVLDFVNLEFFATFFFNALRFLVAVSSDLSGCSCVLKALFSKLSRRSRYSRSLIRFFFFIAHPTSYQGAYCATRSASGWPHGPVGAGEKRSRAGHRTLRTRARESVRRQ